ncbi:MAG: aldehyde dehydrogenase family protein [Actinomycetota bacterium]|nr:aldehyde dehydrogenase family protein [Actinomycetota bacterium]
MDVVTETSPGQVVARLHAAVDSGRTTELSWRSRQLAALETMLAERSGAMEAAIAADIGRHGLEAYLTEIYAVAREVRALRHNLWRWARTRRAATPLVLRPAHSRLDRVPLGVVLIVGPWNYPLNLVLAPLAAALAAGNAAVLKPSEHAPACSRLLAELVPAYLDRDAVAVVEGGAAETGALIDAGVDHVFFTGSAAVGRLVLERAAPRLTPVTLELGGKSPVVIGEGADLNVAARRVAWGKFLNAGQSCIAPDYVLAPHHVARAFAEAVAAAAGELYGSDPMSNADYGRIVNAAHLERLAALLSGHGGEVVCGAKVSTERLYVAPTVIYAPDERAPLMDEEIFGPILPVIPVAGEDHARRFLAERPAPLALYYFGRERDGREFIAATRSGTACINTVMHQFASSKLPFGGVGESGIGHYHGRYGLERLSQLRPVLIKAPRPDFRFAYPPYSAGKERLLRAGLGLLARTPGRTRLKNGEDPRTPR